MSARHVGDMLFPCEFRGIADSTRGFDDIVLGQVASALGFKGTRKLGTIPAQEMEEWTRWSTHVAMLDRYDNMTQVEHQTLPLYFLPSMHMSGSAHESWPQRRPLSQRRHVSGATLRQALYHLFLKANLSCLRSP